MKLKTCLTALMLIASASFTSAYADDASDKAAKTEQYCKDHPAVCEKVKERQADCAANPDKCKEQRQEMMQKMKAKCDADPAACEQKKEEFRDKVKAKCDADPAACQQKKDAFCANHPNAKICAK